VILNSASEKAKWDVRRRMWELLERENAASKSEIVGRIPTFFGAEDAADRLAEESAWRTARVIKAVPDKAQLPVRVRALREAKIVYMAVPKLAGRNPFYLLDPAVLTVSPEDAASSKVAKSVARTVSVDNMRPVDLVVCGSVAVDHRGARIGKGAGYSDIEVALLQEAGLIGPKTLIVTTVHSLQVVGEEQLPETEHDFRVDLIVTPNETIRCQPSRRPGGIIWDHLTEEKIATIPALRARSRK
jgi:5-formyltetrahydrofolate cyclo-ligase